RCIQILSPTECVPIDILPRILSFANLRDRLSLRACSRAMEQAISQSELCLLGEECENISFYGLTVCIGTGLRLSHGKGNANGGLDEIVRLRKRLFQRAIVRSVLIDRVDLNRIPMDFIENFIEGCIFRDLSISVLGEEYNE
ncbi:hypothetical protein PMAYCL1PPCAC_19449, partial [Pristionchus mayeri]